MIIRICTFTDKGKELAWRIASAFPIDIVEIRDNEETDAFVRRSFEIRCPIIFIGALGIAVRKIAPYISDKLTDSPVIVIDEKAENVIPVISGHVGGANSLAEKIAGYLDANAVITTATDVEGRFSIDTYAVQNHLGIVNREGIRKVSAKVLSGEDIIICDKDFPPKEKVDVIVSESRDYDYMADLALYPKKMYVGVGCKKDIQYACIEEAVSGVLNAHRIEYKDVALIASIELKAKEYGLNEFASRHNLEFRTFSSDELMRLEGDFSSSEFVKETTGVGNVCERAAVMAAGVNSTLLVKKTVHNGVTVAIAESR